MTSWRKRTMNWIKCGNNLRNISNNMGQRGDNLMILKAPSIIWSFSGICFNSGWAIPKLWLTRLTHTLIVHMWLNTVYADSFTRRKFSPISPMPVVSENFSANFFAQCSTHYVLPRTRAVGEIFVPIQSMSPWQNFYPAKFLSYTVLS